MLLLSSFTNSIYNFFLMRQKALYAVIFCASFAGFSGIFIKEMSISASSIAWFRTAIPALLIGGWMMIKGIPFFRGNYKKMIWASLLNSIRMYLFFVAYVYTSIGNAVILCYTWPIFASLLSSKILKEKIPKQQIYLLILAFLGLVIANMDKTFSYEDHDFIGMTSAVASAFIYSITVIIFKSEAENYSTNEMIFYQNFTGMILFLPFAFYLNPLPLPSDYYIGFIYAVLIGIIGFNLFFFGLKYLKASVASSLMYLEVVGAIILSYIWYGDLLSWNMIIGGAMILSASFLIQRVSRKSTE